MYTTSSLIQEYLASLNEMARHANVTLKWMRGHGFDYGNNTAEEQARRKTTLPEGKGAGGPRSQTILEIPRRVVAVKLKHDAHLSASSYCSKCQASGGSRAESSQTKCMRVFHYNI
ncbi:hypothetical protein EVAR_70189_1 [Eumeta japonica]|uniref:Uncharacterized protein n=1 Tax=Eumeta variegata TaxID=151549 RepID=A0A4C1TEF9_EUMVA|nr:hypothetical protein EVAR_70189_1 [Eumeta japonica]